MKRCTPVTALRTAAFLCLLISLSQCIVPYESARMLPKGTTEIKAGFSHSIASDDGESEGLNNGLGIGFGYGINERINLKMRYERLLPVDSDEGGFNYLGFGPKFGIVPGKFAMMFPFGVYFAEGETTWGMHPAFLVTLPARNNRFEGTFGARTDIFFESEADLLVALNLGLGFSQNLDRWAIRPDWGLIFDPGESGVVWTFGVGFNYNIGSEEK